MYTSEQITEHFNEHDAICEHLENQLNTLGYRGVEWSSFGVEKNLLYFTFELENYTSSIGSVSLDDLASKTTEELVELRQLWQKAAKEKMQREYEERVARDREQSLEAARKLLRESGEL